MTRHAVDFLARVLSGSAVVALLGGVAAYSGHHMADLPHFFVRVLMMAAISVPCAYLLFRPLERFLASPARGQFPFHHLQRLPLYAGLWLFWLTAITIASHVGAAHGSWASLAAGPARVFAAMVAHVVLFAAYIGLFVYFLAGAQQAGLRMELWTRWKLLVPPGKGRLAVHVVLGFAAVAAAPLLLILGDLSEGPPHTQASIRQALLMDLLAAGLLTLMLVLLIARAVSRPVRVLLDAMDEVDRGNLASRAPILSDDELGALTARFNKMAHGLAARDRVRRTFSRFVPEQVADALIADEGEISPQEREATVLFADIERFTSIASALQPREILSLLNAYFDELAKIIHGRGGVITQFQGDAVLAGFNLPGRLPDHAWHAVQAAMEMRERLDVLPLPQDIRLRMRVGISTGRVVGGTVGGGDRLGYTLHGDTVNLAARLEQLNKELGSRILVDERTAELVRDKVALRDRGPVSVRGFAAPLRVFEPDPPGSGAQPRAAASRILAGP